MVARLCYECSAKWEQHEGERIRILCPACQYKRIVAEKEQRDLTRLKEAVR